MGELLFKFMILSCIPVVLGIWRMYKDLFSRRGARAINWESLECTVADAPWHALYPNYDDPPRAPYMVFTHAGRQLCLHTHEHFASPEKLMHRFSPGTPALIRYDPQSGQVEFVGFGPFQGVITSAELVFHSQADFTVHYTVWWEQDETAWTLPMNIKNHTPQYAPDTRVRFFYSKNHTAVLHETAELVKNT